MVKRRRRRQAEQVLCRIDAAKFRDLEPMMHALAGGYARLDGLCERLTRAVEGLERSFDLLVSLGKLAENAGAILQDETRRRSDAAKRANAKRKETKTLGEGGDNLPCHAANREESPTPDHIIEAIREAYPDEDFHPEDRFALAEIADASRFATPADHAAAG